MLSWNFALDIADVEPLSQKERNYIFRTETKPYIEWHEISIVWSKFQHYFTHNNFVSKFDKFMEDIAVPGEMIVVHLSLEYLMTSSSLLSAPITEIELYWTNTTFNNNTVISWRSVLLVEEIGENHWSAASLYHILLYRVDLNSQSEWW
jgi:hypothetical protein